MLYTFLKTIMQIAERVFFRSITVNNIDLIPKTGPLLIVANHPSTFMDPIVISTLLNREVSFLAKGVLFKSKFAKWFFPKINMIPVYRMQDDPTLMNKNQDTFVKCYEHLEKGGAILIFPEGISLTERKLRTIKTGAARIAFGAEARNDFKLGVKICTIGLNYNNPHKFNQDLFVNIDEPINVKDYQMGFENDEILETQKLTETIRLNLEKSIIAIDDEQNDKMVKEIELLYKDKRLKQLGLSIENKEADFLLTKKIVDAVHYFIETEPLRTEEMRNRLKSYFVSLKQMGLTEESFKEEDKKSFLFKNSFISILVALLGFPLYLYGLINNYLPFKIPSIISKKATRTLEYRGPITMCAGIITFSLFYSLEIIIFWKVVLNSYLVLIYGISLPISGFFAYWYFYSVKEIYTKWNLMYLFSTKSVLISKLIIEREEIIAELFKAKDDYYATKIS